MGKSLYIQKIKVNNGKKTVLLRGIREGTLRPEPWATQRHWAFILSAVRSQGQVFSREMTSAHLHF